MIMRVWQSSSTGLWWWSVDDAKGNCLEVNHCFTKAQAKRDARYFMKYNQGWVY